MFVTKEPTRTERRRDIRMEAERLLARIAHPRRYRLGD
jgi:hypothetical protein